MLPDCESLSLVFEYIWTTDKNGWMCIQRVSHSIWLLSWWEALIGMNMHLVCELLSSVQVWTDQILWQVRLNIYLDCESLSSVWSDKNGWQEWLKLIQVVSYSLVFEQIRTTDEKGWTPIQEVSHPPAFVKIWTTDENVDHISSLWVTPQCLSRSEPLTMTELAFRRWFFPMFE